MLTYDYATRDEIRAFDRYAVEKLGIPGIVLMENAGRQIAETAVAMIVDLPRPRALILAGRGNNGGDAFVVARHLLMRGGAILDVVLLGPRDAVQGDARTNLAILDALGVAVTSLDGAAESIVGDVRGRLAQADLVVDGLLGTGTRGQVREPYASVIAAVNAAGKRILAIDIPSGLDCDTGRPLGPTIRATRTVTMAALKVGFRDPDAAQYTGEVMLADIGVPFRRGV